MAVQISEHTGERVNISINFGVIVRWLLRTSVLKTEQQKKLVSIKKEEDDSLEMSLKLVVQM